VLAPIKDTPWTLEELRASADVQALQALMLEGPEGVISYRFNDEIIFIKE